MFSNAQFSERHEISYEFFWNLNLAMRLDLSLIGTPAFVVNSVVLLIRFLILTAHQAWLLCYVQLGFVRLRLFRLTNIRLNRVRLCSVRYSKV